MAERLSELQRIDNTRLPEPGKGLALDDVGRLPRGLRACQVVTDIADADKYERAIALVEIGTDGDVEVLPMFYEHNIDNWFSPCWRTQQGGFTLDARMSVDDTYVRLLDGSATFNMYIPHPWEDYHNAGLMPQYKMEAVCDATSATVVTVALTVAAQDNDAAIGTETAKFAETAMTGVGATTIVTQAGVWESPPSLTTVKNTIIVCPYGKISTASNTGNIQGSTVSIRWKDGSAL